MPARDVVALGHVAVQPVDAQQRQRVEGRDLGIVGIGIVQVAHRLHVLEAALGVVAVPPEDLDRAHEPLLPLGRRLGDALLGCRRQALQRLPRLGRVHVGDQRMVVGERFAPVGQREVGIDRLGRVELLARLLPAEAVQDRDAAQEMVLRLAGRRGGEGDDADFVELRLRCGRSGQGSQDKGSGGGRTANGRARSLHVDHPHASATAAAMLLSAFLYNSTRRGQVHAHVSLAASPVVGTRVQEDAGALGEPALHDPLGGDVVRALGALACGGLGGPDPVGEPGDVEPRQVGALPLVVRDPGQLVADERRGEVGGWASR